MVSRCLRVFGGLTLGLGLLAGCASGAVRESGTTSSSVPPTQPPTQPSTDAPQSSAPAASTSTAPPTTSAETGATFTMPNEIGKVLQDAQDDIQRVSHDPVFYTSSKDATGRGRHQILDRDWKVCAQNVAAGQRVERSRVLITFSVVKLAESCP
ncbi:MAG TPA: hypothetical protein VE074_04900 [Jatrophihabitantaceae bacterium]|nr:hypothetical protein [Jatrophihabitantaceae bacterium]